MSNSYTEGNNDFFFSDASGDTLARLRDAGWLPAKGMSEFAPCIPALINCLNIDVSPTRLCKALPYKSANFGVVQLVNTMAHLGFIARPAKVRFCDLDPRLLPCLFVPEKPQQFGYEAVVVMAKTEHDSGSATFNVYAGKDEAVSEYSDSLTHKGTAYFFIKEDDIDDELSEEFREVTQISWFRSLVGRFRTIFWQVFALSFVLSIVSLTPPLFVMLVYDKVISAHSPETLLPLLAGAALAILTEWRLRTWRAKSLAWFGARIDNIVNNKIFEQLMFMPSVFTERASIASQITRIKAFESVRDFFAGSSVFMAVIEMPFTLIILFTIALIAGPIAIIPLIAVGLFVALILFMRQKLNTAIRLSSRVISARQQTTVETFEKIHALRTSGITQKWVNQFRDDSGKASLAGFRSGYLAASIETIAHGLLMFAGLATVVWGIDRIWQGSMSTGALIASMILVWRVLGPFHMLCVSLPRFDQLHNAITQVNRLVSIKKEHSSATSANYLDGIKGKISFNKVGLRYTSESEPVFTGLSFDVEPGQIVAVTGSNGTGKSSILKLANGLYQPQLGTIQIDGADIRQLDPIELRQHITYVPQTPHFFKGTIAENLRFSEPLATDETLQVALNMVGANDYINSLGHGIHTVIDNKNPIHSSMVYRLSLARAYIKNASLMLFDELPYALLNSDAGQSFIETLKGWKGYRTIILVTHREDYLHIADKAVLLRNGEPPVVDTPDAVTKLIYQSHQSL